MISTTTRQPDAFTSQGQLARWPCLRRLTRTTSSFSEKSHRSCIENRLWVPELKRFYSAVPQHFVLTVPHGTKDFRADLLKELNLKEGEVAPILPI